MLKIAPAEATWVEILPGVRVLFTPITIKGVRAARRAAAAAFGVDAQDLEEAGDSLSRELIRRGIVDWEGVGDLAGEPVAVSPEAVEHFIANPDAYEAADRAYVWPWANRDAEKNVSAGSPNGISEAVTPADDIASSAAVPATGSDASRTRKRAPKGARTSPTSRSPKKAKPSGK